MELNILNLGKDTIVSDFGVLKPGDVINNVLLEEIDLERIISSGLVVLTTEANIGLRGPVGPVGSQGPVPWKPIVKWQQFVDYTNVFPSDLVSYNGSAYVCLIPHNSGSSFDASKWTLVAIGVPGQTGSQGIPGVKGPSPWGTLTQWSAGTAYTNVAPASLVSYQNQTFVCTVAHTSTVTFDASKFMLVAAKGEQGIQGEAGPVSWAPVKAWITGDVYQSTVPISIVTYLGSVYACTTTHTATATFDASKFILLAAKGAQGDQGVQGNIGPTGQMPFTFPVAWAPSTVYSNTVPANAVVYDGTLYICTTSHTSTSTFDATKWRALAVRGNTIYNGTIIPADTLGKDGDFYIYDRTASSQGRLMYGPKTNGAWGTAPWNIQITGIADVPGLQDSLNNKHNLNTPLIMSAGNNEKRPWEVTHYRTSDNNIVGTTYPYVTEAHTGVFDTRYGFMWNTYWDNTDFFLRGNKAWTVGNFDPSTKVSFRPMGSVPYESLDLDALSTVYETKFVNPNGSSNLPETVSPGYYLGFGGGDSNQRGAQLYISGSGKAYFRVKLGSSWPGWSEIITKGSPNFTGPFTSTSSFTYGFSKDVSSIDLNTLLTPGFYNGSNMANAPNLVGDWFYIEVQYHTNGNWTTQRATSLASNGIWYRTRFNTVWGSWKKIQTLDVIPLGTINSGSVNFDVRYGSKFSITNGGAHTWVFSFGIADYAEFEVICYNAGAFPITMPGNIRWIKGDGSDSDVFTSQNVTLQSSGRNHFIFWSYDNGSIIYGRAV